ncbi:MAG: PLP-dependent cysteine synthase family protein [Fervidicoccaceae archaeon]
MSELLRLVGNTPLVELKRIERERKSRLLLKLEYYNPTGSHKDRIALHMIKNAIEEGKLREGDTVVEASSGNTAISVAFIARMFNLKPIVVVPEETSSVKVRLLEVLGAEIFYGTDDPVSENYYLRIAKRISIERKGLFLNQYENRSNIEAHYKTTAREIWEQSEGNIDAFVMGIGTGGTIMGVGKLLKERKKDVKIFGVTPKGSVLVGGTGKDKIEGLVHKWVPPLLDMKILDGIVEVSFSEAKEMTERLAGEEGILGGYSTGANVIASIKISEFLPERSVIVTIAPDSLFKYLGEHQK